MCPEPVDGPFPSEADPDAEAHGSIRLIESACTSCMVCARECPSWCIHIDSHTEARPGPGTGRHAVRTEHVLDRFAIDWSLCMYCGICVEECPFDALEWVVPHTAAGQVLLEEMAAPPPRRLTGEWPV